MSKRGYEIGSRNVFKDIGVPNPEEHLVKAQLVFKIDAIMKERRLKQLEIADLLGIHVRRYYRLRAKGISVHQADQVCVRLGMHPGEVWPEWFTEAAP